MKIEIVTKTVVVAETDEDIAELMADVGVESQDQLVEAMKKELISDFADARENRVQIDLIRMGEIGKSAVFDTYAGHDSLAAMISGHVHVWRDMLTKVLDTGLIGDQYGPFIEHELKALAEIEAAVKAELAGDIKQVS